MEGQWETRTPLESKHLYLSIYAQSAGAAPAVCFGNWQVCATPVYYTAPATGMDIYIWEHIL